MLFKGFDDSCGNELIINVLYVLWLTLRVTISINLNPIVCIHVCNYVTVSLVSTKYAVFISLCEICGFIVLLSFRHIYGLLIELSGMSTVTRAYVITTLTSGICIRFSLFVSISNRFVIIIITVIILILWFRLLLYHILILVPLDA